VYSLKLIAKWKVVQQKW